MNTKTKGILRITGTALVLGALTAIFEASPFGTRVDNKGKRK